MLSAMAMVTCDLARSTLGLEADMRPVSKRPPSVTETTFTDYVERFLPGLDFVGAGLLGSAALFTLTLLIPSAKGETR